jgi:hypothetical protein
MSGLFHVEWYDVLEARTSTVVSGGGGSIQTSISGDVSGTIGGVSSAVIQDLRLRGADGQETAMSLERHKLVVMAGQRLGIVKDKDNRKLAYINKSTHESHLGFDGCLSSGSALVLTFMT